MDSWKLVVKVLKNNNNLINHLLFLYSMRPCMDMDATISIHNNYRIAGIFRGAKLPYSGGAKFSLFRVKIFVVARYKPHPDTHYTRRFVGKYFVVRFSTTKTTKILPLENYPLYGINHRVC